jgi:indolepyruvate ferredoxin oxidoreductase beta subunit
LGDVSSPLEGEDLGEGKSKEFNMKIKSLKTDILMVGVGGQGIVLASDILCLAAMYGGLDAKKSEIHGMSQRGGSVFSHVRFAIKVYSPVIAAGSADILASLEESETLRWLGYTGKSTKIIYVNNRIPLSGSAAYPEGTADILKANYPGLLAVDPLTISTVLGGLKCLNVAMVGVISLFTGIERSFFERAIMELAPRGTEDMNIKAFDTGRTLTGVTP